MKPPLPTPELVASYEAALYEVLGDASAELRIGQAPPREWLLQLSARSVTLITAWNPFSQALDEAINLERLDRLIAAADAAGQRHLPARGCDPSGLWTPEPGLCVLDLPTQLAQQWLRDFDQFAAVVADEQGCRLLWHPDVTPP
ncbi:DUF3293 domain-containing protein [Burkholderiaceae bacterium UC74_6]